MVCGVVVGPHAFDGFSRDTSTQPNSHTWNPAIQAGGERRQQWRALFLVVRRQQQGPGDHDGRAEEAGRRVQGRQVHKLVLREEEVIGMGRRGD